MFPWVCPRVSAGVCAGDSVDVRGCFRGRPSVAAAGRGCCHGNLDVAVDIAMEIAVACAMASAMDLHGVPLLAAAFRGSPWNFRGSPWKVRGSPWNIRGGPRNAVDMSVECNGGPWTLPRSSAKNTKKSTSLSK